MSDRRNAWWWIGAIAGTGLVSWVPYWLLNIAGGVSRWWRVPVTTPGLFDTYVYLHWMEAAALGLPYGNALKWFGTFVIGPLSWITGFWASVPELWIMSHWLATALTLLIGSWCIRQWSGLGLWQSRWLTVAFWLAVVLTLGFRPGIYSWYLPFCMLGLTAVLRAHQALTAKRVPMAGVWSVVALGLCWVYPWFFLFSAVWLLVEWGIWVAMWDRRLFLTGIFAGTIVVAAGVQPLARWFLSPAAAGMVGEYERNGMVFAHVPFLANTVLAIALWICLLFLAVKATKHPTEERDRLLFLSGGWVTLFLVWFHTPITGIFTYSDHLIGPVTAFAWITGAAVWRAMKPSPHGHHPVSAIHQRAALAIAVFSTVFFLYVLQQPILRNIWKFDSYVIHLAHWLVLAIVAWFVWWRLYRPSSTWSDKSMVLLLVLPSLGVGLAGVIPAFARDVPAIPGVASRTPVVEWVRQNVPATDRVCADPASASFFAAQTGRRVLPAEAVWSWPEASDQVIRDLQTLVGAYDVVGSGTQTMFQFYTDHYRIISCASGAYAHNGPYARVLERLGWSDEQINAYIGCNKTVIDVNRAKVGAAIQAHTLDIPAFRELCPWVIIPDAQKAHWKLPSGSVEHQITSTISVWNTR